MGPTFRRAQAHAFSSIGFATSAELATRIERAIENAGGAPSAIVRDADTLLEEATPAIDLAIIAAPNTPDRSVWITRRLRNAGFAGAILLVLEAINAGQLAERAGADAYLTPSLLSARLPKIARLLTGGGARKRDLVELAELEQVQHQNEQ